MTRRDVIRKATTFLAAGSLQAAPSGPDFFVPYWDAIVKGCFEHPDPSLTAPMLPALAAFALSGRDSDSEGKLLAQVREMLANTTLDTPFFSGPHGSCTPSPRKSRLEPALLIKLIRATAASTGSTRRTTCTGAKCKAAAAAERTASIRGSAKCSALRPN